VEGLWLVRKRGLLGIRIPQLLCHTNHPMTLVLISNDLLVHLRVSRAHGLVGDWLPVRDLVALRLACKIRRLLAKGSRVAALP
jgi:hypothetical protein